MQRIVSDFSTLDIKNYFKMTQIETMNLLIGEDAYQSLLPYKALLEQYRIRRFGVPIETREVIAKIYQQVTGDYVECTSCGAKLYLIVALQWIYNYELKNANETTNAETIVETKPDANISIKSNKNKGNGNGKK
jgi:hypothetical protein